MKLSRTIITAFLLVGSYVCSYAQKQVYIPYEWRQQRTDTLL